MLNEKYKKVGLGILLLIITLLAFTFSLNVNSYNEDFSAKATVEEVYLGGTPIGININADGLLVEDFRPIILKDGTVSPSEQAGILKGDFITKANDVTINTPNELQKVIDTSNDGINLTVVRENNIMNVKVIPVFDPIAGAKKIGIIVKNGISGIGTLTYVDKNGNYCALGHKICDINCKNISFFQNGELFKASILGVYKSESGEAGALKGVFDKNGTPIGNISKNNEFGIYGKFDINEVKNIQTSVKIGSKNDVKLGKAYIFSTLNGDTPDKYEIEIVKAYNQNTPDVKSMVIRVTDSRLKNIAGGIVQGMSGSPIIQNEKIIGAVTHVFLNDATIGYGVYIDWLK